MIRADSLFILSEIASEVQQHGLSQRELQPPFVKEKGKLDEVMLEKLNGGTTVMTGFGPFLLDR